jgi:hypothetical protein
LLELGLVLGTEYSKIPVAGLGPQTSDLGPRPPMPSRRDLLKSAAAASAGIALSQLGVDEAQAVPSHESRVTSHESMAGIPFERRETVRIGIVGTGLRGKSMLNEWLGVDNVRITALCDIVPERSNRRGR